MNYLFLMCLISFFSIVAGTNILQVQNILQPPSLSTIQRALEARGGTYTAAHGAQIQALIHDILKGNSISSHEPILHKVDSDHMQAFLASESGKALTSEVVGKLQKQLPSFIYSHLVKKLLDACRSTHLSIARQKGMITREDQHLESSPIIRTANALALEIVIRLLFTMVSQRTHPWERMHALYILNLIHLSGSRGVALQRYRNRANRFYFTYEGTLREYDPSREASSNLKQIKAIDRFLRLASRTKAQYLHFLSMGMSYGIDLLKPYHEKAAVESWSTKQPGFMWRYAAGLFKEITTLDVIDMRTVPPEKIFAHKSNKDFVELMLQCSLKTTVSLKEAYDLIVTYKNSSEQYQLASIMERYYHDSTMHS